jgi:hypothetical protein
MTCPRKHGDKQTKIRPWWRENTDGSIGFFVLVGFHPIEFQKGKSAISVPSLDKMPAVIDTVIAAVRAGELDAQLAPPTKKRKSETFSQIEQGSGFVRSPFYLGH